MAVSRQEAGHVIARCREGAAIVSGPGGSSGTLWSAGDHPATIYNMEMGYASSVALGVALGAPSQRAWSVEGEGSALAGFSTFLTVARRRPSNYASLVFDNRVFGTGGGAVETATAFGADLATLFVGAGIDRDRVVRAYDLEAVEETLVRITPDNGPWVLVIDTDREDVDSRARGRPGVDIVESVIRFRRAVGDGPQAIR